MRALLTDFIGWLSQEYDEEAEDGYGDEDGAAAEGDYGNEEESKAEADSGETDEQKA